MIRAARYSRTVRPDELMQMPVFWTSALLIAESAEIEARNMANKQASGGESGRRPTRGRRR